MSNYWTCAARNDPEGVVKVVPAGSGDNQTCERGGTPGGAERAGRDWAPHTDCSHPSWPRAVGQRRPRLQSRQIRPRHGPSRQTPYGLPPLRPRRPPLHRPEFSHPASQTSHRYHLATLLLPPFPLLPARPHCFHAVAPSIWRPNHFPKLVVPSYASLSPSPSLYIL